MHKIEIFTKMKCIKF